MQFTASPGTYLEINFDDTFPKQSFAEQGLVLISFDESTGLSKLTGSGFEKIGNNLYLATASKVRFNNLNSGRFTKGVINLSFKTKKTTPKQKYYCSLSRFEANQRSRNVSAMSGIDYVIDSSE